MGFSLNPLKAFTRAVGLPDSVRIGYNQVGRGLTEGLIKSGVQTLLSATKPRQPAPAYQQQLSGGPQPAYNVTYGAPNYQVPYTTPYMSGGSYDAFNYQPTFNPYGGTPSWGYSTGSPIYSTPQYQGYSAQPQDRTWEDLTSLAGAVLPFFL